LTTNNAARLDVGQAQYTLICNETGGVLDDLIVYRVADDSYLMVVNASNAESDFEWIVGHALDETDVRNESQETAIVALQGPASSLMLSRSADVDIESIKRFHIRTGLVSGVRCRIARTGYTGEDGFELLCAWDDAPALWDALLTAGQEFGIKPAGLGARDVLRLEAGYALYGHELTEAITPVDARLMWVVDLEKGDFLGRNAIRAAMDAGPKRLLTGLEAQERCIPRYGYPVQTDGIEVGYITSGTFSPTLQKAIALSYLDTDRAVIGTELDIMVRDKACKSHVVRTPFYKAPKPAPALSTAGRRTDTKEAHSAS
jgi:aminomethyltransferase